MTYSSCWRRTSPPLWTRRARTERSRKPERTVGRADRSGLPRVDAEADDGLLAQRLCSLQPMQALNQHETGAVRPHQDRRLLTVREHALRDLLDAFWVECGPPLDRHVDRVDREILAFHHAREAYHILGRCSAPRADADI